MENGMVEELDETVCKQMSGLVELLTTSGKPSLNPEVMKKFKKICRTSDGYVAYAFDLLMKQLHIKHSEVRLSAYQMIDELFQRSHKFRELLLEDFQAFIALTTGLEMKTLPAPKAVAKKLSEAVIRSIYLWNEKYASGYKKLSLGYDYMKTCKKVNFESIKAEIELERQQQEETNRKLEETRQEKQTQTLKEYSEAETDIRLCLTEIENGISLLMPKPDEFFIPLHEGQEADSVNNSDQSASSSQTHDSTQETNVAKTNLDKPNKSSSDCDDVISDDILEAGLNNMNSSEQESSTTKEKQGQSRDYENNSDNEEEGSSFTQEHGLFSHKFSLTINVGAKQSGVFETEDNVAIIQDVQDQYRLIKTRFLPKVKKWLQTLTEFQGKSEDIKQLSELKEKLEEVTKMYLELEIQSTKRRKDDDDDSDDDDFEDVPDKEGYEEDVPEHVKLEVVSAKPGPSKKSRGRPKSKMKESAKAWLMSEQAEDAASTAATSFHSSSPRSEAKPNSGMKIEPGSSTSRSTMNERRETNESKVYPSSSKQNGIKVEPKDPAGSEDSRTQDGDNRTKESLFAKAPVVSFGVDLEHWENPDKITAPVKARYDDASRFWVPDKSEDGPESGGTEEVASLTRRAITFAGKFEPVKWKCRAPLSSGKLCERMDRAKCSFHGKIIPRDDEGQPTEQEDIDRLNRERILKEIEEADSRSESGPGKGKGKGKGKKRKYPNLTDIRESQDNSRTRIEAKIFKKSTLRKVNAALDAAAMKKISDKFGNQFNYSLK